MITTDYYDYFIVTETTIWISQVVNEVIPTDKNPKTVSFIRLFVSLIEKE